MLKLYCLPGKLVAHFQYLFPGHRQNIISATARRRDSTFAHFLLATPFWIIVIIGLVTLVAGFIAPSLPRATSHVEPDAGNVAEISPPKDLAPSSVAVAPPPAAVPDDAAMSGQETDDLLPAAAAEGEPDAAIDRAVREAFASGEVVRWSAGDRAGYVVPSAPSSDGCRNLQIAADDEAVRPAVTVCP